MLLTEKDYIDFASRYSSEDGYTDADRVEIIINKREDVYDEATPEERVIIDDYDANITTGE